MAIRLTLPPLVEQKNNGRKFVGVCPDSGHHVRLPWPTTQLSSHMAALWLVLMVAVIAAPVAAHSPNLGDDLVRNTVRVSLFYYALAVNVMIWLGPTGWQASTRWGRLARQAWSFGWAAYLVHLAMAFHFYHGWSHADAVEHVREASGFGEGIFVSHLFTLLWTVDVVWWQHRPMNYAGRSPWIDRVLHAFMLFMWFNGTVVYETGPIRWAGLVIFMELAIAAGFRLARTAGISGTTDASGNDCR